MKIFQDDSSVENYINRRTINHAMI